MTPEERFWAKVDKSGDCWTWIGSRTPKGYGTFRYGGKTQYAHRMAAEMAGILLDGATIDHICHNRAYVNPGHLRSVTSKQNSENLSGAHRDSSTGIRGVSRDKYTGGFQAGVYSRGVVARKRFKRIEDAEAWVRAKRIEMFTHNDLDRLSIEPERMSIVRGV